MSPTRTLSEHSSTRRTSPRHSSPKSAPYPKSWGLTPHNFSSNFNEKFSCQALAFADDTIASSVLSPILNAANGRVMLFGSNPPVKRRHAPRIKALVMEAENELNCATDDIFSSKCFPLPVYSRTLGVLSRLYHFLLTSPRVCYGPTNLGGRVQGSIQSQMTLPSNTALEELSGIMSIMSHPTSRSNRSRASHKKYDLSCIRLPNSKVDRILVGPLRHVNHSCDPNSKMVMTSTTTCNVITIRAISPGEEITISYGSSFWDEGECGCSVCIQSRVSVKG